MTDTIKGAIIGAAIPSIVSLLIFFMGDFSTRHSFQKDTVEALSERFESVDKDMSYEKALEAVYKEKQDAENKIDKLSLQLSELSNLVDEKQALIDSLNSMDEIDKILQNAAEYWNNSNYVQALTILNNSKSKSEVIENLYKQYSDEYNEQLLQQVNELLFEGKRDEAVDILEEGSDFVLNREVLNAKIKEIKNKPLVLLSDLIPVSGTLNESQYALWDIYAKDNYNNKYSSGVCLKQKYEEKLHLVYALDGKYTKLTGKFVLLEESKNTDGNYILYAYALDNGQLRPIYESSILTTATRPIDIDITVSGIMDLVIEVYDPNKTKDNAWTALVDAKLE